MLIIVASFLFILTVAIISYRYWPVTIEKIDLEEAAGSYPIIDVRDYQEAEHLPLKQAIQMPCGYIPRYAPDLHDKVVYIAVDNTLECNFAVRMLKRFGFEVKGCICMKGTC